ncbi:MAG: MmgE/PrpD family protein [Betaproteobacteria bacterium]|nr:MmgE/PrpD family protein [Betaproteobacteria bacterium]
MKLSNPQISVPMQQLSSYVAGALRKPLPPDVEERAKVHLIDTFAAMVSGCRLLPGVRARSYVAKLAGKREAGVVGTRIVTSAHYAALANGMCGHADETDDTHPPTRSHPGTCIVPAALAMSERERVSGKLMLRAIVLGYDVCARTLLALAPKPVSSTYGHLFGAAASAAALLKLDARRVRHVFTYAGQQASGLYTRLRDPLHVEKAYAVGGMPAHNGIQAALMVKSGFSGVDDVFSGENNLIATFSPEGNPDELARGLGSDYKILQCGIKCWSVGGPIQGPLHVLQEMIDQHQLRPADVLKLVARLPDKELKMVNEREMPNISVQHLLALMLVDGTISFASSHDSSRLKDARVIAMRRRIQTVGDPALTDPLRRWRCAMEITLKNGRLLTHQTMAAKGTAQNPVTMQDERKKALDLMAPVLGRLRAHTLIAALAEIERFADVRALRKLYVSRRAFQWP